MPYMTARVASGVRSAAHSRAGRSPTRRPVSTAENGRSPSRCRVTVTVSSAPGSGN
ncbi:MAG: hypothetical protein JO144_07350, partial [Actinobacteria bacterium]|nr:hypothetical protein [Actinomycetota bacterium]